MLARRQEKQLRPLLFAAAVLLLPSVWKDAGCCWVVGVFLFFLFPGNPAERFDRRCQLKKSEQPGDEDECASDRFMAKAAGAACLSLLLLTHTDTHTHV